MGNNCVGPSAGGRGFFQSVSAALSLSRNTGTGGSLPAPNHCSINESAKDESAQKAPEPIKIPEYEIRMAPPRPTSPSQSPPAPVEMKEAAEANKPLEDLSGECKQTKARRPHFVKRMRSAGLQTASVLQRETGKLKDVYSLGRKLGQGQFGTTYLCIEKATGKEFACKSIAKRKLLTPEDVEDVRREIQILHHLAGHPNIISIIDAYEDAVAVHVVMELCAGGELFDRIIQKDIIRRKLQLSLLRS
ncbi:hypothetical protein HPP92_016027 [Vanilla planifolia]|uniref:non-specific serine/threonine protein kinase n=1 Tax=Vanilla planifolia TaxID=51239 RepID=A0A835QIE1_VANPL|nr:hypothetical protein HPP92_016027 [Vanilla planifolia]